MKNFHEKISGLPEIFSISNQYQYMYNNCKRTKLC